MAAKNQEKAGVPKDNTTSERQARFRQKMKEEKRTRFESYVVNKTKKIVNKWMSKLGKDKNEVTDMLIEAGDKALKDKDI